MKTSKPIRTEITGLRAFRIRNLARHAKQPIPVIHRMAIDEGISPLTRRLIGKEGRL